jgi:hypothetical protein
MTERDLFERLERLERENRRLRRTGVCILGMALLFVCGVALGQKVAASKLDNYRKQAHLDRMDWAVMRAQVDSIQDMVEENGIQAPSLYFDPSANRFEAVFAVNAKYLETIPAGIVSDHLTMRANFAWSSLHRYVPEAALDDFQVEFRALDASNKSGKNVPGTSYYIFAEFKDGQLTMH